jgi:subtilisin family serine protease
MALPAAAQSTFILTVSPSNTQQVLNQYGLTVVKELYDGPNCVYLVSSASSDSNETEVEVENDLRVAGFEPDQIAKLPELNGATQVALNQSTSTVLESLPGRTLVNFFGAAVPSNYLTQPATAIIRLADARNATGLTGSATVVAIIDTGVDPNHTALAGVLLPGYNFADESTNVSEFQDLSAGTIASLQQSTSTVLEQSTSTVLEAQNVIPMGPAVAAILDQSTSTVLEGNTPQDFGHGTMVAGIVHLVAPTASIMPLRAFHTDGSSNLSDIIRAIYYAADHGADVISMSFSTPQPSPGLQSAVQYALKRNIVVVAAAGNDGAKALVFPASFGGVDGIGSTTNADQRSAFSNFGSGVVAFAAPGEGVISTYPGGLYAAGWGTSFSAPIFAGSAALVLQAKPNAKPGDVGNALSKTKQIGDMGYGRIDLFQSLTNLVGNGNAGLRP